MLKIIGELVQYCFAIVAMGNTVPLYCAENVKANREKIKKVAGKNRN